MVKVIFYTDLHHGDIRYDKQGNRDISLWGNFSLPMATALNSYAENNDGALIVHGGDESQFNHDRNKHLQHATEGRKSITDTSCDVILNIGNHEPLPVNFSEFTPHGLYEHDEVSLYVAQPDIVNKNGVTIYEYPLSMPQDIANAVNDHERPLIVSGHFAFDRHEQGYQEFHPPNQLYGYHDTLPKQESYSFETPLEGSGKILSLHGHEHRFRLTKHGNFNCLSMPSIIQDDPLDTGRPCGLFCEITTDDSSGELTVAYKKINLNVDDPKNSLITSVTQEYMQRNYFRAVQPS